MQFETFAPLNQLPFITHAFTLRTTEDTKADDFEGRVVADLGFSPTNTRNQPLIIRCADCAAVFIVDRRTPSIALVHSGKKGTLADIVGSTVAIMQQKLGTNPADCTAFVSPSIGPCHYEMDIWDRIESQLRRAGVGDIYNPRVCTACHLGHYFSYRAEKGQTGRMFAVLALTPP